jgi:hypothetical protein
MFWRDHNITTFQARNNIKREETIWAMKKKKSICMLALPTSHDNLYAHVSKNHFIQKFKLLDEI